MRGAGAELEVELAAAADGGARGAAGLGARGAALPPRRRRDQGLDRGEGRRARLRRPGPRPALRADPAASVPHAVQPSPLKQRLSYSRNFAAL